MGDIELVVTDLDGTLWDGTTEVHPRTLAAIATLAQRRVPLLVATGRRRRSAATALARAGLHPPAVLLGGALGVHLSTGEEFHRRAFTATQARAVLEAFLAHDCEPVVYLESERADAAVGPAPSTRQEHLTALGSWVLHTDLHEVVATDPVVSFGVIGRERERLEAIVADIAEHGQAVVNRDHHFGDATLMVAPPDVHKWEGVRRFCQLAGIDASRVLAIGDGENDLELLDAAAVAVVVSDACDEALARADHVIAPAAVGGWADVLDLLEG